MVDKTEAIHISKYLSLVLRHQPQKLEITLDEQGWADVSILLEQMNKKGFHINMKVLEYVVETNSKKRFAFNTDRTKIRASQGHSILINLGYEPVKPPEVLYHGTGEKAVASILNAGLNKMNRHHVHLSTTVQTALKVGQRHGRPVIFQIAALEMYEQGFEFFVSANEVWLTDQVPATYLSIVP